MPDMSRFRRFEGELALESSRKDGKYRWIALRRTSLRTGIVNPASHHEPVVHALHAVSPSRSWYSPAGQSVGSEALARQ